VGAVDLSQKFTSGKFPAPGDQDGFLQPQCTKLAGAYAGSTDVITSKNLVVIWNNVTQQSWAAAPGGWPATWPPYCRQERVRADHRQCERPGPVGNKPAAPASRRSRRAHRLPGRAATTRTATAPRPRHRRSSSRPSPRCRCRRTRSRPWAAATATRAASHRRARWAAATNHRPTRWAAPTSHRPTAGQRAGADQAGRGEEQHTRLSSGPSPSRGSGPPRRRCCPPAPANPRPRT